MVNIMTIKTVKEYLDIYNKGDNATEEEVKALKEYNKNLTKKYPFLLPYNRWSVKSITTEEEGFFPGTPDVIPEYDYEYTELDAMPEGWRIAFSDEMLEELRNELIKFDALDSYKVEQIKEKYGSLRWYSCGYPTGHLSEPIETVIQTEFKSMWRDSPDDVNWSYDIEETENGKIYKWECRKILDRCNVDKIENKYEALSEQTCIRCGKSPTKWESKGWINYYCDDCAKEIYNKVKERYPDRKFEDEFIEIK